MSTDAAGGTYTLVIELPEPADIVVGALGRITFDAGWYAYVGSALGSGGFSRIDRHRELAAGDRDTRHWHIDYLLGHPETRLDTVVTTAAVDGECPVARELGDDGVPAFGCSDCRCNSHLFFKPAREEMIVAVESAHEKIG
ncbi:MAG: GIY-YIG nuclease family protein [Halovenus sp.]